MRRIFFILVDILLLAGSIHAQDKALFRENFIEAEYFFFMEEYEEALYLYNELLKTDPTNYNLNFLIGACYLSLNGQKSRALPYLEEAVKGISAGYREGSYKERFAPRESLFALARTYHIMNRFDPAIEYYQKYRNAMIKNKFADIEYVNAQIKSCELAESMVTKPIEVQFLAPGGVMNENKGNYNPVFSGNDSLLIFMVDKPFYHAIMMSRLLKGGWSEPVVLNGELGSDGDCYPVSLSFNGRELYLVKKNQHESDIYVSRLNQGHWTSIEKLNTNINTEYNESHASISADNSKLYFTSDRPGGYGALDIWVSEKSPGKDWGKPKNLGAKVNSFYNEDTPFITIDGKKLYFSSQGHATMGGYDIFITSMLPDGNWSFSENIGYPVSTAEDDLFYVPRKNGEIGYLSTVDSLSGDRIIYAVRMGPKEEINIGVRKQKEGASDTIAEISQVVTEEPSGQAGSTGEEFPVKTTEAEHLAEESHYREDAKTEPLPEDQYWVLNSIMFDFNRYDLNDEAKREADRIIEVLLKYPEINVELTGHTDAVGTSEYNIRLSNNRANTVAEYFVKKGLGRERISVKGVGESKPVAVNKYEDGTDSPEGRRLNRHVSVRFTNLNRDNVNIEDIFVPENLKPNIGLTYSVLLTSSETELKGIPEKIGEEQIVLIITDRAFLYTAGNMDIKSDAIRLLNLAIDNGFPDSRMMEKRELETLIKSLSDSSVAASATFTIQVMALRKPRSIDYFSNLKDVTMYKASDGLYKYVYGSFPDMSAALKELPRVRKMGYKDAFIVYLGRYKKSTHE
jgi:outer membrane protein OmpA-like peptidoglycan-associated protein/tetratricopeptide (TPR) repeat protein